MTQYRKVAPTEGPVRTRRTFTAIAVFATVIVVADITVLVLFLTKSSPQQVHDQRRDVQPLDHTFSLDTDPLIVTDLRVVHAASDDAARDVCLTLEPSPSEWTVAGQKNLNTTTTASAATDFSDGAFTYLCMRQQRTLEATIALATGMYVNDVLVTFEPTYVRTVPGWTTEPTAITLAAPNATLSLSDVAPVYLSYRRPSRPISAVRVLHVTDTIDGLSACRRVLGDQWEQGGDVVVGLSQPNGGVYRAAKYASPLSVLVDVAVVDRSTVCCDGFSERQNLTTNAALCARFQSSTETTKFVADLLLQDEALDALKSPSTDEYDVLQVPGIANGSAALVIRRHTGLVVRLPQSQRSTARLVARPTPPASNDKPNTPTETLTFKILQLADLHYTGDASHECRNPPQDMIDRGFGRGEPDFVVFGGDNVEVLEKNRLEDALNAEFGSVEKRKIPYAVVFGNHDDENGQTRQDLANHIIGRPFSHMQWGPTALDGVGNYQLSVEAPRDGPWGSAGSKVFQMYFLDSHGSVDKTAYPNVQSSYDWIKPRQIAYYKQMARTNLNASTTPLPAVMFFHIPIPEYASVGSATHRSGEKNERLMSSEVPSNLFSALVEMGDVKATFVGHDHVNEYCFGRHGVQLYYGGGAGFVQAYGSAGFARRTRVIEWSVDQQNKRRIKSWKRHAGSAFATRHHEEVL